MESNPDNKQYLSAQDFFTAMTERDLRELGVGDVAYVRRRLIGGLAAFILHAADGEELTAQNSETAAQQSARCQDLNLVTVH